jgi:hypothetical protein
MINVRKFERSSAARQYEKTHPLLARQDSFDKERSSLQEVLGAFRAAQDKVGESEPTSSKHSSSSDRSKDSDKKHDGATSSLRGEEIKEDKGTTKPIVDRKKVGT